LHRETAEEFGVFGQFANVNLQEGKAFLKRRELLKELFLSVLPFRETAFALFASVDKAFHDDTPLSCAEPAHGVFSLFLTGIAAG
jgi:hypothetical protein